MIIHTALLGTNLMYLTSIVITHLVTRVENCKHACWKIGCPSGQISNKKEIAAKRKIL